MSHPGPVRRILANFAILSTGEVVARLLTFAAIVALTRALGVESFGVLAFALAAMTYAELAVGFGLDHLGQLEVAREDETVPRLATAVVLARLGVAALAYGALAAFALAVPMPEEARAVILLFGPLLLARALQLDWTLLGAERMAPVAGANVVAEAALAGGVLALVDGPADLVHVPLIYFGSRTVLSALLWIAHARRFGARPAAPDAALARRLVTEAAPIAATIGFGLLFYNLDQLLLGLLSTPEESGLYGATYRLVLLLSLVSLGYFVSLRPLLGRASVTGFDSVAGLVARSYRITAAVATGVAVGGILLARPILVLLFGEPYGAGATTLQVLLVAFIGLVINRHHLDLLVAFRHQRSALVATAAGALVNLGLDLIAIPRWGATGAAGATVVAEAVVWTVAVRLVRRRVGPVPAGLPSLRTAACAALLAGFLLLVGGLPVLLRIALGGVLYGAALVLLGVVRIDEIRRALDPAGDRGDAVRDRRRD